MSALAFHYLHKGCKVSGYDRVRTPLTRDLERAGADVHYEENPALLAEDVDVVVYTPAIPADHAEWAEIRRRALPVFKRAEILGRICRDYRTLAVAGTHGKTTTSSLLAYLLRHSIGCNAILGGISLDLDGNYHHDGQSPWMVTEADEYDRSFWQLHPFFSVVTAWDADHLDIYGSLENMRDAYRQFMRQSRHFIVQAGVAAGLEGLEAEYVYGLEGDAGLEERMSGKAAVGCRVRVENGAYRFDYEGPRATLKDLELRSPGRHNIENTVAAISLALEAGVEAGQIRALLPGFQGVARRLERKAGNGKCVYYDDYAHHPVEIAASVSALREFYPEASLVVLFQPHLYTRTRDLAEGFARSLSAVDELFLVDIYPARELPLPGVDTRLIGEKVRDIPVRYGDKEAALAWVEARLQQAAQEKGFIVLVTMGAGDIDRMGGVVAQRVAAGDFGGTGKKVEGGLP